MINLIAEKKCSALSERVLIHWHGIIRDLHSTYITAPLLIKTSIIKKQVIEIIEFS